MTQVFSKTSTIVLKKDQLQISHSLSMIQEINNPIEKDSFKTVWSQAVLNKFSSIAIILFFEIKSGLFVCRGVNFRICREGVYYSKFRRSNFVTFDFFFYQNTCFSMKIPRDHFSNLGEGESNGGQNLKPPPQLTRL